MSYKKHCFFVFSLVYFASNVAVCLDLVTAGQSISLVAGTHTSQNQNNGSTQNTRRNGPDTDPIDVDYFFGRSSLHLRTTRGLRCPNCVVLCESENYACHNGICLCAAEIEKQITESDPIEEASISDSLGDDQPAYLSLAELTGKPGLRHHIAHFCPNLDIARKCIRSCMQLGKPAFCGKDHRCYCGHKYNDHDVDPVVDPDDIHAQFRDLYTKYFGALDESK